MRITKLFIVAVMSLLIIACNNTNESHLSSLEPKYKISNEDIQKWIIERSKIEQCLYPKKIQTNLAMLSESQQFLYYMVVYNQTLNQVIGYDNYQAILQDPYSQQYLANKLQKFGHSKKVLFQSQWCNEIKKDYNSLVKSIKTTSKKQTSEQSKLLSKKSKNKTRSRVSNSLSRESESINQIDVSPENVGVGENASFQKEPELQPESPENRIKLSWDPIKQEVYSY